MLLLASSFEQVGNAIFDIIKHRKPYRKRLGFFYGVSLLEVLVNCN